MRAVILLACLIGACSSHSWVRLDPSATAVGLPTAQRDCRLDEMLARLEQARQEGYTEIQIATTNENMMAARADLQLYQRAIRNEIDDRMRSQG